MSFQLGQRVKVVFSATCAPQKGTVAGMGWHVRPREMLDSTNEKEMVPHVLVALDIGFYGRLENGDKVGFVSLLPVHPDCLRHEDE